ncbi:hypothetical protein HYG87_00560 [Methanobacterium alkalithermotolerans]|uniref:Uncharacterized protein n=1 Tax=Methanobacterium alkalithermotolerans TaxID=2731220 RepID=A0A8T8K5G6_9EURY|nr:hypothetical protein [Methanobacterium alkalithermotolerans]QUH22360.1 hypothetical protein HYG87_00560 [Methanobacterium alkalithermotolerans]
MKIYPNDKRIHYSLKLKEGKNRSIQLFEHIESINRNYSTPISIIFSWRSEIIKNFADRLQEEKGLKKLSWGDEFDFKVDEGMRILVAMKLASSIEDRLRIEEAFDNLRRLSDEEVSFWVWKILSLKNKALTAFKAMYL